MQAEAKLKRVRVELSRKIEMPSPESNTRGEMPCSRRPRRASATVKTAAISGSGVFRDANTDERARQVFFSGEIPDFQVIIPGFGIVQGPFQITALEYAGSHNGEATYEVSLASAGVLTFTAL